MPTRNELEELLATMAAAESDAVDEVEDDDDLSVAWSISYKTYRN
jgi:hypothetical protein